MEFDSSGAIICPCDLRAISFKMLCTIMITVAPFGRSACIFCHEISYKPLMQIYGGSVCYLLPIDGHHCMYHSHSDCWHLRKILNICKLSGMTNFKVLWPKLWRQWLTGSDWTGWMYNSICICKVLFHSDPSENSINKKTSLLARNYRLLHPRNENWQNCWANYLRGIPFLNEDDSIWIWFCHDWIYSSHSTFKNITPINKTTILTEPFVIKRIWPSVPSVLFVGGSFSLQWPFVYWEREKVK